MSRIAFTGTRKGMTSAQCTALRDLLQPCDTFGHGDCVGADAQAHAIARNVGCNIISRPCNISAQRAWTAANIEYHATDPIQRNHELVDEAEILIAAPSRLAEELRSGTWATIRYARKRNIPVIILAP